MSPAVLLVVAEVAPHKNYQSIPCRTFIIDKYNITIYYKNIFLKYNKESNIQTILLVPESFIDTENGM